MKGSFGTQRFAASLVTCKRLQAVSSVLCTQTGFRGSPERYDYSRFCLKESILLSAIDRRNHPAKLMFLDCDFPLGTGFKMYRFGGSAGTGGGVDETLL